MKSFIVIFLYLFCLIHQTIEDEIEDARPILLVNDPSYVQQGSYRLVSSKNDRVKRQISSLSYPEFTPSNDQCDPHVYTKLSSCSDVNDCSTFASCLQSIHCPLNIKSYGSLIINLLHLLDIDNCHANDLHSSCSNDKQMIILHDLLTHWTHERLSHSIGYQPDNNNNEHFENYCHTISNFQSIVKEKIQEQCPNFSQQVNGFLHNYECSTQDLTTSSTNIQANVKDPVDWSKLDRILEKISTVSSDINHFEENEDLFFIDSNKNLLNTTNQTVYVNDHQYYNVSYVIPKSEGLPLYYVDDHPQSIHVDTLKDHHRSALPINLKFDFPFYGHSINKIVIGTGGFIYTGDLLHSALIGSTQYIAPFMANFDASIGGNQSDIRYFDNGTHFICTWKNLYLQDQKEAGPFTFQAILQATGDIYFNYVHIPQVTISDLNHAHRLGLSDAYMTQHFTNEHIIRFITLYDKLNLEKEKIHNGVSIVFSMDNTCNTFTDCTTCLANRGKRYNCSWCDDVQRCSDGRDRSRHEWIKAQCHRFAVEDTCPNSFEETFDHHRFLPSTSSSIIYSDDKIQPYMSSPQHSALSTFRTIVVTLLMTVLIVSLVVFLGTYIYAYRHPTSPPGMWLLEHRPSTYIARFKRFTGSSNDSS